jgi:hypothetical protein
MGLTKPRAAQIFNLDYKQSTRVVTATNITLTGGAPNSVDGVNLSLGDRVLVTGQTTGTQNGLYQVTTLGSGANGTWARTSDGNENGEIEAGMIVMVTEGAIYADTQWKLITDDPIVINTTTLTFTQNYMANSISSGTSNVVVNSNANVTVSSAGTANVLTVSNTGAFVSGVTSVSGNIQGGNIRTAGLISATGAVTGAALTGTSLTVTTGNITAGNLLLSGAILDSAQLDIQTTASNANIALAPNGTGIVTVSTQVSAVGNVVGGNVRTAGLISATGNITGGNILTSGSGGTISGTGNITSGNIFTAGVVSATGNVTANYFIGNGACLTGVVTSLANINNGNSNVTVIANSNVTVGIAGTSNVAVFATTGEYITGLLSASGNITGGNILTVGQVSATGNVSGNFFVGNGAFLTGLSAGTSNGISNGATSISIPVASGNIAMSVAGQANTVVINLGSFTMYGTFAGPKNLNANVTVASEVNAVLFGPVSLGNAYNITVPDSSTLYVYSGA